MIQGLGVLGIQSFPLIHREVVTYLAEGRHAPNTARFPCTTSRDGPQKGGQRTVLLARNGDVPEPSLALRAGRPVFVGGDSRQALSALVLFRRDARVRGVLNHGMDTFVAVNVSSSLVSPRGVQPISSEG